MSKSDPNVDRVLRETDYYKILGVPRDADDAALTKAYRKLSQLIHPDKCDHPKAGEAFHKVREALDVLKDKDARSAINAVAAAEEEVVRRRNTQNEKTRKLREELERKEAAAAASNKENEVDTARKRAEAEIARIRAKAAKAKHDAYMESLKVKAEVPDSTSKGEMHQDDDEEEVNPIVIKVRWSKKRSEVTEKNLESQLKLFGTVYNVKLMQEKRKGFIFMKSIDNAEETIRKLNELNHLITFEMKEIEEIPSKRLREEDLYQKGQTDAQPSAKHPNPIHERHSKVFQMPSSLPTHDSSPLVSLQDYEAITLTRIRQAEERRRLNAELERENIND